MQNNRGENDIVVHYNSQVLLEILEKMGLLVKEVLKVRMVCLVPQEQRENQVTPLKYFCCILQLLFSIVNLTRTIWEGLIRSFCGAKDNFISLRGLIFTEFTDFSI